MSDRIVATAHRHANWRKGARGRNVTVSEFEAVFARWLLAEERRAASVEEKASAADTPHLTRQLFRSDALRIRQRASLAVAIVDDVLAMARGETR